MNKKNLLNYTVEELENEMAILQEPKYRAQQIFISVHKNNVNEIKDIYYQNRYE
ncbi:MAG: hypothetical protein HGGPFJEG_02390 [Ignavibacteria bacterium]|nr:hypothetical protein [Ignavibacteria bacterium]